MCLIYLDFQNKNLHTFRILFLHQIIDLNTNNFEQSNKLFDILNNHHLFFLQFC